MSKKYLYYFSEGNDAFGGDKVTMKNTLGGKGAGLAEMTAAGMPVPQGFTITTDACTQYYADGRQINDEITADIFEHLKGLEEITGKKFGDNQNPLLVSVRSGARQSMPGMMDTILNLGLNDEAVEGLAKKTGNARFAYDCYRRFVQMFADVVMMVPKSLFEVEIDKMKEAKGVKNDVDLTADDLKELVGTFKKIYEENEGRPFPQDPRDQLIEAVKAVFRSWDNPRANVYRKMNEIPYEWGTAVNVQQMAFGNSGDRSGTGVAFTRDPATGAKKLMGEYLINAQGEDVVAGVRTPSPISHLKDQMPEVYDQFVEIATRLENYFRDMQDMEFTIEDGHLYMLQTRNGKRTAQAALQIACDLVDEGMITEQEAVLRVEPKQLDTLLHPQFDAAALKAAEVVGKGLAASPGSACGQIVFTAEEAEEMVKSGKMKKVVLVRLETSPEDIVGMQVSQGILTVRGGMTSHAAVVARGMGTCCVSGCGNDNEVKIDEEAKTFEINGHKFVEGDWRKEKVHGGGMVLDWGVHLLDQILYMYGDRKIETVYASLTNVTNQEVDDGFTAILTFEGGTEVLVEVGTNNYISLPRWYVLGEDGTAVIRDWQLNGEIIRKTGMTEETVVPVKTAAGLTKTMAPRREDTIVKEDLPKVSGDIADFHRNVVAVIRDGAEPEIKLFQVMRVMKLMEAIFRSAETNQVIEFQDQV